MLSRADRLQPFLLLGSIGFGLLLAAVAPSVSGPASALLPVGVFALIYLVMLGVEVQRVVGAFAERRFLVFAILLNFVVNPFLAWALGQIFLASQPDLRVGLLLFLLTPCIGWYLIFTELAGGDVALGVSLLVINLVLQVILLPVYLLLFEGQAAGIGIAVITRSVLLYLVLPAALASGTRLVLQKRVRGIDGVAALQRVVARMHLKTLCLGGVVIAMFASEGATLADNAASVGSLVMPLLAFFGSAFGAALLIARFGRLPHEQSALLAFTTTSRNSEASLAIAATAFSSPLVAMVVVVGPVLELPLLILMVRVLRARQQR